MKQIPASFCQTIIELHAQTGKDWLQNLPGLLRACAERWQLTVLQPVTPLSYNYVVPAIGADGRQLMLKLGVPHRELFAEIAALRLVDGQGAVMLQDIWPEEGALLLERLIPGQPLSHVRNVERRVTISVSVMQRFWKPAPAEHNFPSVNDWAQGMARMRAHFAGGCGPFSQRLVEKAESLFSELLASMQPVVLLHGDLHPENILSAQRSPWLAIDPKGLIGEPAYEVGALLRNLEPFSPAVMRRSVDQLAEALNIDRHRVIGWGLAQAVLSAWWSVEDHGHGWEGAMACAKVLDEIS